MKFCHFLRGGPTLWRTILQQTEAGYVVVWVGVGGEVCGREGTACRGRLGQLIIFYRWSLKFSFSNAMFRTIVSPSLRGAPLGCVAAEEEEDDKVISNSGT